MRRLTCGKKVVKMSGLEPPTPCMSSRYSNQLSYTFMFQKRYSFVNREIEYNTYIFLCQYLFWNFLKIFKSFLTRDFHIQFTARKSRLARESVVPNSVAFRSARRSPDHGIRKKKKHSLWAPSHKEVYRRGDSRIARGNTQNKNEHT